MPSCAPIVAQGTLATLTAAVRPPARFGGLQLDGDRVKTFVEKPQACEGWINGGFFVFEPAIFDRSNGDATWLEQEPLAVLAADSQLTVYRHEGFWQPMDTLRDKRFLEELWPWTQPQLANRSAAASCRPAIEALSLERVFLVRRKPNTCHRCRLAFDEIRRWSCLRVVRQQK